MKQPKIRAERRRLLLLTPLALAAAAVQAAPLPGGDLDPLSIPKYVTPLVIPPVMKNTGIPDDYDIAVRQFQQQILPGGIWNVLNGRSDAFPATTVWSYGPAADPMPDSSALNGGPGIAPAPNSQFNYPAYTVEANSNLTRDPTKFVTVDWINELVKDPVACKDPANADLTACNYLPHLLPIDRSLHWANPEQLPCIEAGKTKDCAPDPTKLADPTILQQPYTGPVPMVVHVHGAHAGPESDGYAEAWWLPNANNIPDTYAKTGTYVNQFSVATNDPARPGVGSYSYPNDQPSATVWYHDHSLGMTRSNVYAGPAGFWILRDPAAPVGGETGLVSGVLPGPAPVAGQGVLALNVPGDPVRAAVREIPIAIQDRSFNANGSLFYPDNRAFFEGLTPADLQIPFIGDPLNPSDIAAIWNPEAFFNTMVVNGVTWPTLEVEPDLYRFRILNGCNSRMLNLSLRALDANGTDLGEVPFYQIGAEQSLLPKVVKIVRGDRAVLPGNGSNPTLTSTPLPDFAGGAPEETVPGLLMANAERADVLVDFSALPAGTTRVRMINTGPDSPFGGFPIGPVDLADPDTTGQVMEFLVGTDTAVGEGFTAPESLVLDPVKGVDLYPGNVTQNVNPTPRDQALLEEESLLICVNVDAATGAIVWDPQSVPGTGNALGTCVDKTTGQTALSLPMAPKAAVLGVNGSGTPRVTLWSDPIETNPVYVNGVAPTETWEFWNHTVDAHPVHVHEVKFKVLNREAFSSTSPYWDATLTVQPVRPPEATEAGWKDTVMAYPGDITRIAATFDIQGLYVWHCHIVEHEDNEMMVPYCVGNMNPNDPNAGPVAPGCALAPPVAVDDSYSTDEDTALTVPAPGVLANDTDINLANTLTAKLVTGPVNGTLTLNADGSFTYTPKADYNGTDTFTYLANDGSADSPTAATVTITVNPVNDPPVANPDAYTTAEDTALLIGPPGVLGNDTDVDAGTTLTAALISGPSSGTLSLGSNGGFLYTPNANFNGTDSFTYVAFDGTVASSPATVTITVTPVNDAPVAVDDAYTTAEDTALLIGPPGVLGNDTDVDAGTMLTAALISGPTNGTLSLGSNGGFGYIPNANFNGTDSFTYVAFDGTVASSPATVTITVTPVNNAPVAVDDAYTTAEETPVSGNVLANDTDVDVGTTLTASLASGPSNGSVTLNADGSFTYSPNANFNGVDAFTYTASDGIASSNVATVTITVTPVNDAPVADPQSVTTPEDTAVAITLTGSDADGDSLTYSVATGPANGILSGTAPNLMYTPNANFNGPDSFTFVVNDGTVNSAPATVSISVTPVNDPPVARDDSASTAYQTPVTIDVLANDTDVDGPTLTVGAVGPASNGTVTCGTANCTYTPNAGFSGVGGFTYQASDGSLLSNVATVTVTVGAQVNLPPVAANDAYSTAQGTTLNVPAPGVLTNDSDPNGNPMTAVLASAPANGTLVLNANGSFSYKPKPTFAGTDSFTYQASDGSLLSNVATVTLTVNAAPVQLYLSLANNTGTLTGLGPNGTNLAYADEDILSWNGFNYAMYFDGSVAKLPASADLTGFDIDKAGNRILMSFAANTAVPGVGTVTGSDIVAYQLPSGPFSLVFDGSDVGLTTAGEQLDAVQLLPNGHLVVSTTGLALVPSRTILPITALGHDLLEFTPSSLGANTKGTWSTYFDGSDVGLTALVSEDVDAAAVVPTGGTLPDIYLSTAGNFSVTGVSGQNEDVFRCTPSRLGTTTRCTFAPYFDGTARGLGPDNVDGIDLP